MLRLRLLLLCSFLFGCSDLKRSEEAFPVKHDTDWITYEGCVPLNAKDYLCMELSMLPGNPGEGVYELKETLKTDAGSDDVGAFKGIYTAFSTPGGEIEIHFQNSAHPSGFKRTSESDDGKRIREEQYRVRDLVLRKDGEHTMIAIDNANEPISLEADNNLHKRTSGVFTVEGKFAYVGDSSVFYETNTAHVWPVAKQGEYYLAARQYHQLTSHKNEGVYLKGIGYSIIQSNSRGKRKESLVFKKVISMSSIQSPE